MKTVYKPLIIEQVRTAIQHARENALEITHIELTPQEWSMLERQTPGCVSKPAQPSHLTPNHYLGHIGGVKLYLVRPEQGEKQQ